MLTKISVPTKLVLQIFPKKLVVLGVPTRLVGTSYSSESCQSKLIIITIYHIVIILHYRIVSFDDIMVP